MLLLWLAACRPDVNLYFAVVDGGSVRVDSSVATFDGFGVGDETWAPPEGVDRPLPVGLRVLGGEVDALAVRFGAPALRFSGVTDGGTPFTMRVEAASIPYGAADLSDPAMALVLDASLLVDGAALDARSAQEDPDPDDGEAWPLVLGPQDEVSVAFAAGAPDALWLGTADEAPTRYAGRWPWSARAFRPAEQRGGCAAEGEVVVLLGSDAPDTGFPPIDTADTGGGLDTALLDTGWADTGAAEAAPTCGCGGCGGSADSGDSGGDGGGCGGGDSVGTGYAALAGPWAAMATLWLRRRREGTVASATPREVSASSARASSPKLAEGASTAQGRPAQAVCT